METPDHYTTPHPDHPDWVENQLIMYHWSLDKLRCITPNGNLIAPIPAPLSNEQIQSVYLALVKTPEYKNQYVKYTSNTGHAVAIEKGVIVLYEESV